MKKSRNESLSLAILAFIVVIYAALMVRACTDDDSDIYPIYPTLESKND